MKLTIVCSSSSGTSRSFWWRQRRYGAGRCWIVQQRRAASPMLPWPIWCKCCSQCCAKSSRSYTKCPRKLHRFETSRLTSRSVCHCVTVHKPPPLKQYILRLLSLWVSEMKWLNTSARMKHVCSNGKGVSMLQHMTSLTLLSKIPVL
jgi:hypothetical protein